ncbi:hypothetical protein P7K49_008871 [Saguinus oedipus]|uniref:Uncharacterized protein n=1 Tax=Saguinus oedipus TaxID=9490 RepID=A0ABQ9VYY1_SAGOE|nr:hypothetical protein P7K49_008871 [Saguinus oedipus]
MLLIPSAVEPGWLGRQSEGGGAGASVSPAPPRDFQASALPSPARGWGWGPPRRARGGDVILPGARPNGKASPHRSTRRSVRVTPGTQSPSRTRCRGNGSSTRAGWGWAERWRLPS